MHCCKNYSTLMSFFLRASYIHHGKENEYQRLNQIDEKF
jgi:hypothetical protein